MDLPSPHSAKTQDKVASGQNISFRYSKNCPVIISGMLAINNKPTHLGILSKRKNATPLMIKLKNPETCSRIKGRSKMPEPALNAARRVSGSIPYFTNEVANT